jgi:hypothetical protein
MSKINQPTMNKAQLLKSVLIALLIGGIVLVTAVLPAEYNLDPIGTGKLFGFSKLYVEPISENTTDLKIQKLTIQKLGSSVDVIKPIEANNPAPIEQYSVQNDIINIVVPAGKGIEYKFKALKYACVKYEWASENDQIVFLDFHGEVKEPNPPKNVFYESYTLAYSANMAGTFTAPFEGKHGWYFKNNNKKDVQITIKLKGQYKLFDL